MGDPAPKDNEQAVKDALVPIAMPAPKPAAPKDGAQAVDNGVPTVADVLYPQRPSLAGEDPKALVAIVQNIVNDLYTDVLMAELVELRPALAQHWVPAEDAKWVLALIKFAVEATATLTLAKVGGLAAGKLFVGAAEAGEGGGLMEKAGEETGKAVGQKAADWVGDKSAPEPAMADDASNLEHGPTASIKPHLVDDYLEEQRIRLVVTRHDAESRLILLAQRAAQVNGADLARLDVDLRTLIADGTLRDWFRQRVALEWMNVLARLSLGRRPRGQTTNFAGANTVGGFAEAGINATKQWRSGDGFVDIYVAVDDAGALAVDKVSATGRPGVANILAGLDQQEDAGGQKYKLGSMPVFRRIWIKTGPSPLEASPAFVITPEGALEINYDDPQLAHIGGARELADARAYDRADRYDGRDPDERARRTVRATHAMIGAQKVTMLLAQTDTEKFQ